MPDKVFVSYSHKDRYWRRKVEKVLGGGQFQKKFKLSIDNRIPVGANWKNKIDAAISSSRIALLLVSNGFLQSKFIANDELRKILKRHHAGAVRIFWIPIDEVSNTLLQTAGLDLIEAAWPPRKPLSRMKSKGQQKALTIIGEKLVDALGAQPWDDLKQKVAETLGDTSVVLGNAFAEGDYSVFYKATQGNVDVAIKALVPAPGRSWLSKDFVRRANIVRNIANSTAIEIRDVVEDDQTPCVVMEFVRAPNLEEMLEDKKRLEPKEVAKIIAQLVRMAGHLHDLRGQPVLGPVRPSHVHYDKTISKAFISLVPIASETLESCREQATRLLDSDALPYLSPERYHGQTIDGRVDQYHLGLLALALFGNPPAPIKTFAELQTKARFLQPPRSYFDKDFCRTQPAFSFVLARMLETDPDRRWNDMAELSASLDEIAAGKVPEAVKQHAAEKYDDALRNNQKFFRSFYRILFQKSKDVEALFKNPGNIGRQAGKLNNAMTNILNFTHNKYGTSLGRDVDNHSRMPLKPKHFGLFRDAFLEALVEADITDDYSLDAWRAILDPALDYMRDEIKEKRKRDRVAAARK